MFERITVFPLYPSSGKSTILQKWGRSVEGWSRNNTNMAITDRACKTTVHIMLKNSYPHTYSMQYANCNVQPCAMCIIIAVTELQQRFSRWRWTDFLIECEKVPFYSWHWKIIKVSLIWLQTWIYSMLSQRADASDQLKVQSVYERVLEIQFSSTKRHAAIMSRLMFSCITLRCGDDRGWAECCSTPPACAKKRGNTPLPRQQTGTGWRAPVCVSCSGFTTSAPCRRACHLRSPEPD